MRETHIYDYTIRVLVCKEDGEFIARALEMDLLGHGTTQRAAVEELIQAIDAQVSFARQMKDESLIIFPAEKVYFDRWEKAHNAALAARILGESDDRPIHVKYKAITVNLNRARFRKQGRSNFVQVRQELIA